jgi:hypothetical protein
MVAAGKLSLTNAVHVALRNAAVRGSYSALT